MKIMIPLIMLVTMLMIQSLTLRKYFFDTETLLTLLYDIVCCKKRGDHSKTIHELSKNKDLLIIF